MFIVYSINKKQIYEFSHVKNINYVSLCLIMYVILTDLSQAGTDSPFSTFRSTWEFFSKVNSFLLDISTNEYLNSSRLN